MARILFLLGAYYPAPKANGICCERVITEMQDRGYHVDVIAFSPDLSAPQVTCINGVTVHHIRGSMDYRTMRDAEIGVLSGTRLTLRKKLLRGKNILLAASWPSNSKICTGEYYRKAVELHEQNRYDMIIGAVSPISALEAAHMFKKRYPHVKMVAYFLDAVSGGITPAAMPKAMGRALGLRWEQKVLRNADRVIIMQSHKNHHETYSRKYPYYGKIKALDIPLLRRAPAANTKKQDGGIHIAYVGTIQVAIRNPVYFLKIAKQLPDGVVLDIYGYIDHPEILKPYMDTQKILVHGAVSYQEAMTIQQNADFLLNIGNRNDCLIPSKIFEYMSFLKPIITTYSIPNEPSIPYLKRYAPCLMLEEDETLLEENVKKTTEFIREYTGRKADQEAVLREFSGNLPTSFADEIDRIFLEA